MTMSSTWPPRSPRKFCHPQNLPLHSPDQSESLTKSGGLSHRQDSQLPLSLQPPPRHHLPLHPAPFARIILKKNKNKKPEIPWWSSGSDSAFTAEVCVHTRSLNHVWLFVTPWTVAHQSLLSMGLSWQQHWNRLLFPPLVDLLDPGIEFASPACTVGEGNGTPLQCSCLENPRDRGA